MTSTEADEATANHRTRSTGAIALFRLAFPLVGVLLAILYVESTYGRIRLENLYYPYFVISVLGVLTLTVFATEFYGLIGRKGELSFVYSVRSALSKWNRSIGFTFVAIAYIWLIEPIGFFIATIVGVVGAMLVGGQRDPLRISISTVLIVVFVYVMFIHIMGLRPPQGPLAL